MQQPLIVKQQALAAFEIKRQAKVIGIEQGKEPFQGAVGRYYLIGGHIQWRNLPFVHPNAADFALIVQLNDRQAGFVPAHVAAAIVAGVEPLTSHPDIAQQGEILGILLLHSAHGFEPVDQRGCAAVRTGVQHLKHGDPDSRIAIGLIHMRIKRTGRIPDIGNGLLGFQRVCAKMRLSLRSDEVDHPRAFSLVRRGIDDLAEPVIAHGLQYA